MRSLLSTTAAALALGACTQTQLTNASTAAQVACLVDGALQPVAAAALAAAGQAGAATTDQLLVHPLVVQARAALKGTPVATGAASAPAPVTTPPAPATPSSTEPPMLAPPAERPRAA